MEITWIDILVGLIIVASAVYAAWKGLLRETLSIFAWALAAYAALVFGRWLHEALGTVISPPWLSYIVAYGGIFLIVLIPLSFLSYRFSESIQKSPVGPVDRTLGFVFGIGRGLVLVALPYIAFTMLVPVKDQPGWIASAATLPLVQRTSDVLLSLVPGDRHRVETTTATGETPANHDKHRHHEQRTLDREDQPQQVEAPPPKPQQQQATAKPAPAKPTPKPVHSGHTTAQQQEHQKTYGAQERRALDRLIETTGSGGSQSQ